MLRIIVDSSFSECRLFKSTIQNSIQSPVAAAVKQNQTVHFRHLTVIMCEQSLYGRLRQIRVWVVRQTSKHAIETDASAKH